MSSGIINTKNLGVGEYLDCLVEKFNTNVHNCFENEKNIFLFSIAIRSDLFQNWGISESRKTKLFYNFETFEKRRSNFLSFFGSHKN